jgi:diacylglycerol diphosphate phosphatase/phosphatidate phosphatase
MRLAVVLCLLLTTLQQLKGWLALAPFSGAALVAISRTMDYRRAFFYILQILVTLTPNADHWQDVLVGAIVGTAFAYFAYRQYYPSLSSEYSHRPYSPRIKRDDDETLPTHNHNNSASSYPFAGTSNTVAPAQPQVQHASDEEYELEGTVLRPHPPDTLEGMWRKDHHAPPVQERSTALGIRDTGYTGYQIGTEIPSLPYIRSESPRLQLPGHVHHGDEELR